MSYLINREEDYPYKFFTEAAFHEGQVVNMIFKAYEELTPKEEIISPKCVVFKSPDLAVLGQIGRIVKLGENYEDLFFPYELNEKIRDMDEKFEGDLIKVKEELRKKGFFISTGLMDEMYEQDIKTCFDRHHIFYLDEDAPYYKLRYEDEINGNYILNSSLKNIPIKRVW